MKEVFEAIRAAIIEYFPGGVEVWTGQLLQTGREYPYVFPACFVSFEAISYSGDTSGTQKASAAITLLLAENVTGNNGMPDVWTLKDAVYKSLVSADIPFFERLERTGEKTDPQPDALYILAQSYEIEFTDRTAEKELLSVPVDFTTFKRVFKTGLNSI